MWYEFFRRSNGYERLAGKKGRHPKAKEPMDFLAQRRRLGTSANLKNGE
jgi:hypothetical protein